MQLFSDRLAAWLYGSQAKTLQGLIEVMPGKGFGLAFLLLMLSAATPLPTGGVTHFFEIITMLLACELIVGRHTIWLPKSWRHLSVAMLARPKVASKIIHLLKWFERLPRWHVGWKWRKSRLLGVAVLVFTATAFIAPPFSGLDTLPAFGVVLIALAMSLDNLWLLLLGFSAGSAGVVLLALLGRAVLQLL
jgi:hypothetical protein